MKSSEDIIDCLLTKDNKMDSMKKHQDKIEKCRERDAQHRRRVSEIKDHELPDKWMTRRELMDMWKIGVDSARKLTKRLLAEDKLEKRYMETVDARGTLQSMPHYRWK